MVIDIKKTKEIQRTARIISVKATLESVGGAHLSQRITRARPHWFFSTSVRGNGA
jgi:hypothetical protein